MAKKRTTVNAPRAAAEPLQELQAALKREFGVTATREDIVGALIFNATPAQLVGMYMAFIRHVESIADGAGQRRNETAEPSAEQQRHG
jgi:hypothetical protein